MSKEIRRQKPHTAHSTAQKDETKRNSENKNEAATHDRRQSEASQGRGRGKAGQGGVRQREASIQSVIAAIVCFNLINFLSTSVALPEHNYTYLCICSWYMVTQRYLSHYLPHTRPLHYLHTHTHAQTHSLWLDSSLSSCQPFVMGFSFDSCFIPDFYCRPCFAHFVRKLQYLLYHHHIIYRFLHLHTRPPDYNYTILYIYVCSSD